MSILWGCLLAFAPLARLVIKDAHLQFALLSSALLNQVVEQIQHFFQQFVGYFLPYWRGNFLCSSSGSCLLPLCSIRGEGRGRSVTAILLDKIKAFLRGHHVIHFPVNDTSSSYSCPNDLVCVALLGGEAVSERESGNESGHCLEMQASTHREMETKAARMTKRALLVLYSPCCIHQGGTVAPCIWLTRHLDLTLDGNIIK